MNNLPTWGEFAQLVIALVAAMSWFQSWTNGWLTRQAAVAGASGHHLQICLEPALDNGQGVPFVDILAGYWAIYGPIPGLDRDGVIADTLNRDFCIAPRDDR